jgi:hypothetical protein
MNEVNWTEVVLGTTTIVATVAASLVSYFTFRRSQETEMEKLRASQEHDFNRELHGRKIAAIAEVTETLAGVITWVMENSVKFLDAKRSIEKMNETNVGEAEEKVAAVSMILEVFPKQMQLLLLAQYKLRVANIPDAALELSKCVKATSEMQKAMSIKDGKTADQMEAAILTHFPVIESHANAVLDALQKHNLRHPGI